MSDPDDRGAFSAAAERVRAGADHHAEAASLVARMALDEKLECLDGDTDFWPGLADMVSGGYHEHAWPAAAVERLGIPGIRFADGPRGCVVGAATCFPVSMARGATFDPDLEQRIGEAIGVELRAAGATFTGAVCLNLLRHPGWGRAQETYGEDPHHVGEMAAALTRGLQSHVLACTKHFALNSIEEARFRVDVTADERAMHEVYLPHFRRVASEGVASVMSAYNAVNGEWCGEHRELLTDVLRTEWGWDGFVVSDFIAGLRDPVASVTAGLDIEMPFRQQRHQHLHAALGRGDLAEADVDASVVRTVATLLRFEHLLAAAAPPSDVLACAEHVALARDAAVRSMVLLRNRDALLPVDPAATGRVAVLGRLAAVANLGDGGSSDVHPPHASTVLDGIRDRFADVVHDAEDATIADGADLAVVVVGLTKDDEGEFIDRSSQSIITTLFPPPPDAPVESVDAAGPARRPPRERAETFSPGGDRRSLRLHDADERLVADVAARCARTVVVVMGGSAIVMPWMDDVAATIVVWYPGMAGGAALADVLTGAAEPGGRLPFAIPVDEAHLVPFDPDADRATYDLLHGQWRLDADGRAAHRPFGFGLGYTTWSIRSARAVDGAVEVELANVGERPGSTVVQVYASKPGSAYERPPRRLVAFRRVDLDGGVSSVVAIPYDLATVAVRGGGRWIEEPGPWTLTVGQHADDDVVVLEVGRSES